MVYEGRGFRYQGEIASENFKTPAFNDIYEGRGLRYQEKIESSFDDIGIFIAFIGNFSTRPLSSRQVLCFSTFLDTSLRRDVLMRNFTLFLQDQLIGASSSANGILDFLLTRPEFHKRE